MRFPYVRRVVLALVLVAPVVLFFSIRSKVASSEAPALVPIIGATKTVAEISGTLDGNADPGDVLEYTITVNNTGPDPATGLQVSDQLAGPQTLVGASLLVSPIAVNDSFTSIGNVGISVPDGVSDILANDTNPNGGGALTIVAPIPTTSTAGGQVTINANGSFTYNPPPGFEGSDTFTYTLGNGTGLTNTATVTITVSGMIWFVQTGAAAGDGRLGTPFNCFVGTTCFDDSVLDQAGDNIFLYSGAYTGGQTLLANQRLIGQGATAALAGPGSITGITIPPFSNPLPATGGVRPTMTTTVAATSALTLGSGNTLRGFDIGNTTAADIVGAAVGTFTASEMTLNGTGRALDINTGTLAATFDSITSTSSTTQSIVLQTVAGSLTMTAGTTISGSTTQGILVSGSTANITFNNTTVTPGTDGVSLQNNSAGTRSFGTLSVTNGTGDSFIHGAGGGVTTVSGATTLTNPGGNCIDMQDSTTAVTFANVNCTGSAAAGVFLDDNSGAVTFADLDIDTDANVRAFHATDTTAVSASGAITIGAGSTVADTGTATAVEIVGATAALRTPINIQFTTVSATGGANGIIVTNTSSTGSPGGFRVLGSGTTDGSGGAIQSTTGRGASFIAAANIFLNNMNFTNAGTTDLDATNGGLSTGDNLDTNAAIHLVTITNATLTNVDITGGAEQGINGNNVSAFNLVNSTVTNVGNAADEDNIHFFNMSGTSAITGTTLTHTAGGGDDNLNLQTTSGTLNLTISGSSAVGAPGGAGIQLGSGFLFGIRGTTNATITFNNSAGAVSSTNNFSGGLVADVFDSATMVLKVSNFTSSGNNDQLSVSAGDNSNVDLEVTNSTLSSVATGDFVVISLLGSAFDNGFTFDTRIQNNTITVANGLPADGIIAFNAGGGFMNMAITGNTFDYSGSQRAIAIQGGQDGAAKINATVTGNNIDVKLDGANNAVTAIFAQVSVASPSGDNSEMCADIGGTTALLRNTVTHSLGGANMAAGDIRLRQRFDSIVRLPGYGGGASDEAAVVAYLAGRNTLVNVPTATSTNGIDAGEAGAQGMVGGAACTQPTIAQVEDGLKQDNLALRSPLYQPFSESSQPEVQSSDFEPLASASVDAYISTESIHTSDYLGQIDGILSNVSNFAREGVTKLGEMISPTAHAQEPETGELVQTGVFALPANESVTVKFRVTVNAAPFDSGVDNITNTANISGTNFTTVNASSPAMALDAEPDLIVTKTDGSTTTEPGELLSYTLTYSNSGVANANGAPQHTANVVLTETVPTNTTFNLGASTAGWSCANGAPAGTVCTLNVGAVNAGAAAGNAIFTVNLPALLPVSAVNVPNTSTIAESPANFNGTDRNTADNTTSDTDNIIGNWDGSTSTDWNVAANWSNNVIPPAGNNISIPDVANAPAVTRC